MTELRQRMDNAMLLRSFAERTRESYLYWVRALAKHYRRSPDHLDGAAIESFLLYLITNTRLHNEYYTKQYHYLTRYRFLPHHEEIESNRQNK